MPLISLSVGAIVFHRPTSETTFMIKSFQDFTCTKAVLSLATPSGTRTPECKLKIDWETRLYSKQAWVHFLYVLHWNRTPICLEYWYINFLHRSSSSGSSSASCSGNTSKTSCRADSDGCAWFAPEPTWLVFDTGDLILDTAGLCTVTTDEETDVVVIKSGCEDLACTNDTRIPMIIGADHGPTPGPKLILSELKIIPALVQLAFVLFRHSDKRSNLNSKKSLIEIFRDTSGVRNQPERILVHRR